MLNYSLETTEGPDSDKGVVKMSYTIVSAARYKKMTKERKEHLKRAIDKFIGMLKDTKKSIK